MDTNVMSMINEGEVNISAPMVRNSKLPFRLLVRKFGCDIAFTPMIVAKAILSCEQARNNEFVTNEDDRPLIVQFAANTPEEFAGASEVVAKYCDGVDLNCGCPQRWANEEGYGTCLMNQPQLISDLVKQTRNRLPLSEDDFTVSVKCRVFSSEKKTVDFVQQIERAGVSWISVHGRTKDQRREPVNLDIIKTIVQSVQCPIIANGDIKSLNDCVKVREYTGAKGVMAARGLLTNPALFAGHNRTPVECIKEWVEISSSLNVRFLHFHQHLMYMCEKIMSKAERRVFNALTSWDDVVDYLGTKYNLSFNIPERSTVSSY
ncbi:hypothetical protein CHUAL_013423 [Chamberlinius hualienensis]